MSRVLKIKSYKNSKKEYSFMSSWTKSKEFLFRSGFFALCIFVIHISLRLLINQKPLLISVPDPSKELFFIALIFIFAVYYLKDKINNIKIYSMNYKASTIFMLAAIACFALHIKLLYFSPSLKNAFWLYEVIYFFYYLGFVCVGAIIYQIDFIKKQAQNIGLILVLLYFYHIIVKFSQFLWYYSAKIVVRILASIASIYPGNVSYSTVVDMKLVQQVLESGQIIFGSAFAGIKFVAGTFTALIGPVCSGIDSLLMFTLLFVLFYILYIDHFSQKVALASFAIGFIGVFLLNILRIYIIILVGQTNPQLAINIFHTNLGWMLFSAYNIGFLLIMFKKYIRKK